MGIVAHSMNSLLKKKLNKLFQFNRHE